LKTQPTLLFLAILAMFLTVACGDSHSVPQFTKLAFLSNRSASPATPLFSAKLDGTSVTAIPSTNNSVYYPSYSADFQWIAYYSQGDAWVQKADGTGLLQLTNTANNNFVRIFPNGKKVLYTDNAGHVQTIHVDGTAATDLTPTLPTGITDCYSAGFSADSSKIVIACEGASVWNIYTLKSDGTGLKLVLSRTAWTDTPSFSPDGSKIYFAADVASNTSIESVNIDGTGEIVIIPVSYEAIVLNSSLYYSFYNTGLGMTQVYKSKLDGTSPTSISDGTSTDYLALSN
jgi:Tol biopolymer transport system component